MFTTTGQNSGNHTITGTAGADHFDEGLSTKSNLILAGDGNDTVNFYSNFPVTVSGGNGNDSIAVNHASISGNSSFSGAYNQDSVYGDAGNDTIAAYENKNLYLDGGDGNDVIFGTHIQNTTMVGGDGDDEINFTTLGGNKVDGGTGNDHISWSFNGSWATNGGNVAAAADTINAGAGDDKVYLANTGNVNDSSYTAQHSLSVSLGDGNDTLTVSYGTPYLKDLNIDGGAGNDVIDLHNSKLLGSGTNLISGGDGNDLIIGGSGRAYLSGDAGNDTLVAGDGNATLLGGLGDDSMVGGTGNDLFYGDAGKDTINGGAGTNSVTYSYDTTGVSVNLLTNVNHGGYAEGDVLTNISNVVGGSGDDTLFGNNAGNLLNGGLGNDLIVGGAGNDYIDAGDGNDIIYGRGGNNTLIGGAGNDLFYGDTGKDNIDGGTGTNGVTYFYDTTGVSVNLLTGVNHGGFAEGDVLKNISNVVGGSGNDSLVGDDKGDLLNGYLGNDFIVGGKGNDYINAGDGNDTLISGGGKDTLIGGQGADLFVVKLSDSTSGSNITDFTHGQDHINILGSNFQNLSFANVDGGTMISDVSQGINSGHLFLTGVDAHTLSSSDFLF